MSLPILGPSRAEVHVSLVALFFFSSRRCVLLHQAQSLAVSGERGELAQALNAHLVVELCLAGKLRYPSAEFGERSSATRRPSPAARDAQALSGQTPCAFATFLREPDSVLQIVVAPVDSAATTRQHLQRLTLFGAFNECSTTRVCPGRDLF